MSADYDFFSCFCLYDECSRSKYERDTYLQLVDRIYEKAICETWIVRAAFVPHKIEKRYVSFLTHCRRISENISLTPAQNEILVNNCLKIDFDESLMIHCYQFYENDEMEIRHFLSCLQGIFYGHVSSRISS